MKHEGLINDITILSEGEHECLNQIFTSSSIFRFLTRDSSLPIRQPDRIVWLNSRTQCPQLVLQVSR